jgi:glycosyltransferase involved in cell wall biosynthesis
MRRVLFLAYYFPPLGGAGVQRSLRFVQYLPELGFEAVVVTGPEQAGVAWAPPDRSLQAELPEGTIVYRTQGPQPDRSRGWRARSERWLRLGTPFARWWVQSAIETGRKAAREHEVDVIYASMSPFETGEAAARLARELGKPWVADLRDPWALDEWLVYPTALHRQLELRRMRFTLAAADAVVMNTPEATRQVRRRFAELRDSRVTTIPNGFEPRDFAGPDPVRDDDTFRIVHAGYVHVKSDGRDRRTARVRELLGGSARGLEIGTRSHVYLLEAVQRVVERRPELLGRIEVHLAGVLSEDDRHVPGFEAVREHGYLPHDRTVELLRSADLLFLPMHDLPPGRRSRIVPGKTYEYLAARRPILGAVPDGDARDLLEEVGNNFVCRPADVAGMAGVIEAQVDRKLEGRPVPEPRSSVTERYERPRLAAKLAEVLDGVQGRERAAEEEAASRGSR